MKKGIILKGIRLMTFIMAFALVSSNIHSMTKEDEGMKSGKGEGETAEKTNESTDRIEEWMLEEKNFHVDGNAFHSYAWVYTTEELDEIQLENWMLDYDHFNIFNENNEQDRIEDWMLKRENYRVNNQNKGETLESWMTDSDFWKLKD